MGVMPLLIIASFVVAAGFLLAFIWAVNTGQFNDSQTPSFRVLWDDSKDNVAVDDQQSKKEP
jgi:cbb3-type cytochrome oxidase maturation protein